MDKKTKVLITSVIVSIVVAAGVAVLIWWLVRDPINFTVIELTNDGFGDVTYSAAFTRIDDVGDVFWWFYPTTAAAATTKPLILWLDGLLGLPPSVLANFGMFGPLDFNLNKRENSWAEDYNLLFVDAPIGTGFSTPQNNDSFPKTLEENADHLTATLRSFYRQHGGYSNAPLYIVGQGSGAQLALALASRLPDVRFTHNLQGVVVANGIISPAQVLTKLGFYLEELAYIEDTGRADIEAYSAQMNALVEAERYAEALDSFLSLGEFVNEAGAVAVNLGYVIEKLRNDILSTRGSDYFAQLSYLKSLTLDGNSFMDTTAANALGITTVPYDSGKQLALAAVRDTFMIPAVERIEHILNNTDIKVIIYNGNLDAVSNTPGQLEWVNNLKWDGQEEFLNSKRETLVVNRLVEGYFRGTDRLKFYWMNSAGQSVPIDSPAAMRRLLQLITGI